MVFPDYLLESQGISRPDCFGVRLGSVIVARSEFEKEGSDAVAGFISYDQPYPQVLVLRHVYVVPAFRDKNIMAELIEAAAPDCRLIIFQTNKKKPPKRVLAMRTNAVLISEDEHSSLWHSEWRGKNG